MPMFHRFFRPVTGVVGWEGGGVGGYGEVGHLCGVSGMKHEVSSIQEGSFCFFRCCDWVRMPAECYDV
jgi:hypothetical protein